MPAEANKRGVGGETAKSAVKEAEGRKCAQGIAVRLASVEIEIARKVGETDALFGSVTNADIAEALAAKRFEIDPRTIALS